MSNIIDLSLTELVSSIKNKKISSFEATSAFVDRSKKSKKLNSYNEDTFEIALEKAKQFDSNPDFTKKLPGIPMAVKDLFCTKNIKTTASSKILNNFIPTYESTVTHNLWNDYPKPDNSSSWHTFSAFWLRSSVVSVLISMTTDIPPTGGKLVIEFLKAL